MEFHTFKKACEQTGLSEEQLKKLVMSQRLDISLVEQNGQIGMTKCHIDIILQADVQFSDDGSILHPKAPALSELSLMNAKPAQRPLCAVASH